MSLPDPIRSNNFLNNYALEDITLSPYMKSLL